ncbi:MAG TPA: hypothetical protein DEE98_00660 [Elusimicrobia bacterium]|nr:MAG: hypothetical protein A2278_03290 [Elusimicrobia bacterium RIFOXYA12_FULL_49_49]OGS10882.1 MAG: hypothetical protein A2386_06770 [Elusimicrobia bacterium RIFOXYB1_FULL_48_9]OGS15587.1 MAG: hypothetical protein A2251_03540 [Elusimicrobia bacterium RIFOXYA2_FULL_47_53]OGS26857.1 MAG: hypothetical protein A2339_07440 [Elusimicrobia bacterium RIFOXYB12_FULL_50_12]OGS30686.1 MAG: hypothetical protein A2323_07345 [Elusimicrobia bacterium RIFOXYB2_FULL_46_23]HBU68877.1 hypothetical protein [El
MKVLLIYPNREQYIFGITPHVYIEADAGNYPPIGLLYIAAYLKKHSDIEVSVLDAYTRNLSRSQIKDEVRRLSPDIVGVYFSTYYLYDSVDLISDIKEVNPAIVTVAGGPHSTLFPREAVKVKGVDYVMTGESEESFLKFARLIETGKFNEIDALANVLSLSSPSDKAVCDGKSENLDELPFPARELLDTASYRSILAKRNPITTVITSRGCPFKCHFCSNIESGKKVRYRSASNVVDELQLLVKDYGIRDFLLFDELFTSNKERTHHICDEILKRGLKIRWHCRSRADVLDRELVAKMKKAGCRLIQFGIETGNQRLQKAINKNLNLESVRETVAMVYDAGIYTYGDFMFGLPGETAEETAQTLEYAKSLKLDYVAFGMFHPVPGSYFYGQGLAENKFEDFWMKYIRDRNYIIEDHSWTGRDREKFHLMMAAAYRKFYFRPGFIFKKIIRLDSLSQLAWQAKSAVRVFSNLILKRFK